MDSLSTPPSGESFTPIIIKNEGNVIEFIDFSFSGVPFDHVDTTSFSGEYYRETRGISLMPGEQKDCSFIIEGFNNPISNLYWRGIQASHPGTEEVYLSYIDSYCTLYVPPIKNRLRFTS